MLRFRNMFFPRPIGLVFLLGLVAVEPAVAASDLVIITLTRKQIAENEGTYFNCDHEGKLGCLIAACRAKGMTKDEAATVQFLYRDVTRDFPELVSRQLTACFLRAGGSIR